MVRHDERSFVSSGRVLRGRYTAGPRRTELVRRYVWTSATVDGSFPRRCRRRRTYPRVASVPTPPGSCVRRSPTTCCALPASWPKTRTPAHEDRRYAAGLSPSRPDWPAGNADRSRTYPPTGPGPNTGLPCGATRSDTARHYPRQPDPSAERPDRNPNRKSWADQQLQHAHEPSLRLGMASTTEGVEAVLGT
jgi:hypothetical protein